jgi:hypothetical protein
MATVLQRREAQELITRFRGQLVTPEDQQYDHARRVYNAMIDKRPALIAQGDFVRELPDEAISRHVEFGRALPSYVSFMMDEGQERVQSTYRDNHARLQLVKARYDPHNVFHVNQNIRPAASRKERTDA